MRFLRYTGDPKEYASDRPRIYVTPLQNWWLLGLNLAPYLLIPPALGIMSCYDNPPGWDHLSVAMRIARLFAGIVVGYVGGLFYLPFIWFAHQAVVKKWFPRADALVGTDPDCDVFDAKDRLEEDSLLRSAGTETPETILLMPAGATVTDDQQLLRPLES